MAWRTLHCFLLHLVLHCLSCALFSIFLHCPALYCMYSIQLISALSCTILHVFCFALSCVYTLFSTVLHCSAVCYMCSVQHCSAFSCTVLDGLCSALSCNAEQTLQHYIITSLLLQRSQLCGDCDATLNIDCLLFFEVLITVVTCTSSMCVFLDSFRATHRKRTDFFTFSGANSLKIALYFLTPFWPTRINWFFFLRQ
jgi:hypothetical protein